MNTSPSAQLAVIGGGAMAEAILRRAFRAGVLTPAAVIVADPDPARRATLGALGVVTIERASAVEGRLDRGGRVLLAVKPQALREAAADLGDMAGERCVISILAGVTIDRLRQTLGRGARIIRTMPNLPARVGKGITALAPSSDATGDDVAFARSLFDSVGGTIDFPEDLMDAFTAVAGSGPAYVFYLAEAMIEGAVGVVCSRADAGRLVRATISGAAALLDQPDADPTALRATVTSKKGTTDAAITVLEERGVREAVACAIAAARDRGLSLSQL